MTDYFKLIDTKTLDVKLSTEKFPFRQNLFWDAPVESIDIRKHQRYIIERVLTRGCLQDFYMLLKIYSTDEIKTALRKSKELDPKTIKFCSQYFNIPESEMHISFFYY